MGRIPRFRRGVVAQTLAIDVADHRRALGAAGPIAAGPVLAGRESFAVRLRAGQDVVIVRRVADAGDHGAALGLRYLHAELVAVAVKIVDVLRNDLPFELLPGAASDTIAAVDGLGAVGRLG